MGALYQISFPNGKSYIGMTASDVRKRFWEHKYQSRRGLRLPLYSALRKFGIDSCEFKVLVIAKDRTYLETLERDAIKALGTRSPYGYNCTDGGDGAPVGNTYQLGLKRSAESRARMSAAAIGRKHTPETKAKIGAASKGNKYCLGGRLSDEHKVAISAANKGRKWSESAKVNMARVASEREARKRAANGR